jgi:hypothetical protein
MQEKSESFSEFAERTEILARRHDLLLSELPDFIGVSPSMFFAYRSGKKPISQKAWRKLETAEKLPIASSPTAGFESSLMEAGAYRAERLQDRPSTEPATVMDQLQTLNRRYGEVVQDLAEANRKLDALMDLLGGKVEE